jgi:aspartate carbamoyltransferase catalytic subunit
MKHLTSTRDLSLEDINSILKRTKELKSTPYQKSLKDKLIITIFFENSTRTRSSFEIAAKRLGAQVVSLDVSKSSTAKGETLFDTASNLDAMEPDAIIVRHKDSGVPKLLSNYISCPLINGGDGSHAHPSQALLDLFTIKEHFGFADLKGKKIAIVGDIKNSRVANSNIELLNRFGLEVILVAPPHFMPKWEGVKKSYSIKDVAKEVDIIMSLRTQVERHATITYASLKDYANDFCITKEIVKDRDILLLHPGPVNRNIDISDEMLLDPRCKVLTQVKNGVYTRMAILEKFILEKS